MFAIYRAIDGAYLFGNKTFVFSRKRARKFTSWDEAKAHIDNWFENGTCCIEKIGGSLD